MINLNFSNKLILACLIVYLSYIFCLHFNLNRFKKVKNCDKGLIKINNQCRPLLNCDDVKDIQIFSLIGQGSVKLVYLAKWKYMYITLSKLTNSIYKKDFMKNIKMLKEFESSSLTTQYFGDCNQTIIFTRHYPYGNALTLPIMLEKFKIDLTINQCLKLCVSYLKIIDFLHRNSAGVRVMCDSNSLEKTLTQYLIDEEFNLILNDLDAIPKVNKEGIKCGKRQLFGNFVAPEQLWPYPNQIFENLKMPNYDEKIDIWKIPDVCDWFINLCSKNLKEKSCINEGLKIIKNRCKSIDPKHRPNSSQLLAVYKEIYNKCHL